MSKWAAIALAAPGCLLAVASAVALALAAFDRHPMWPHQSYNLAEAAGVRDQAEVARLIEDGADPNARYPVTPGFIFDAPTRLTPLEAAVAADDALMLGRLLAEGARLDAALWAYLRCIAGGDEVPPLLEQHRPPGAELQCDGVRPPWPVDD
jgi:hypothetical protein